MGGSKIESKMISPLLHSFGLDISDLSAKLVMVKTNFRGERVIHAWMHCEFPEGVITDGEIKQKDKAVEILTAMHEEVRAKVKTPYVIASLPESKTFIKVIEIDVGGDMASAVMEELPNHIPLALDEIILDWSVAQTFEHRAMITVGAAPKSVIENYTDLLAACGLKPTAFEIEAQAITRSLSPLATPHFTLRENIMRKTDSLRNLLLHRHATSIHAKKDAATGNRTAQLIVDLGATRTSLIMVDWSTIQFTSNVPLSGVETTKQIANRLKLSFEEAERAKRICGLDAKKCKGVVSSVLEGILNNLTIEIERSIDFYQTHFKRGHAVSEVLLTGGGANLAHAETVLAEQLSIPVHVGNPLTHLTAPTRVNDFPKKESLSFTTAIGLSLRDTFAAAL